MTRADEFETDILVVGSGAAGLTAALAAADAGSDTLVIEKSPQFGGTSATSGGVLWIPASHRAQAMGHPDSAEEGAAYIASLAGDEADPKLIRAFVDNAPDMLDYLEERAGIVYNPILYPDYHVEQPGGKPGYRSHDPEVLDGRVLGEQLELMRPSHPTCMFFGFISWTPLDVAPLMSRGPGWIRSLIRVLWRYYSDIPQRLRSRRARFLTVGNALIARLKLALDRREVPLWLNAGLVDLMVEKGRVTGAKVMRDGIECHIRARRGIILAAGGFERSKALRETFLAGSPDPDASASQPYNTGDALEAAVRVGAATVRTQNAWWAPTMKVPGEDSARPLLVERALPGAIIVNRNGERFINEAASYHVVGREMARRNAEGTAGGPYFMLFDAAFRARYPMGPLMPGVPDALLSKAVRSVIIKARTVEELARKIGVPAKALTETIDRFNRFAAAGKDDDFSRGDAAYDKMFGDPRAGDNPCLAPLLKAPYYALAISAGDIGTSGGLWTDGVGAVLNEAGERIEGLYAVGNTAASVMGESYPGAGSTLAPGMTFGCLAARHAARANDPA